MIKVELYRIRSSNQGTLGLLICPDLGVSFKCIELPDRNNKVRLSRVKADTYKCKLRYSNKYKWTYMLENKHGRSYVLIHNGNLAGDVHKGYKTHSAGCIILGSYFGKLNGQDAVLSSRTALRRFNSAFNGVDQFQLTIYNENQNS